MKQTLLGFIEVARVAGIAVSTAESLEALRALELVGIDDRRTVRDALEAVIVKTADERERFGPCFERYFALGDAGASPAADDATAGSPSAPGDATALDAESAILEEAADSALARILLADDRAALVRLLHAAAAAADLPAIRLFTQTGAFVRRILEAMGIEGLDALIERLRTSGDPERAAVADDLDRRRVAVRELARDLVERRVALRGGDRQRLHDAFLSDARLANVDPRDVERMRALVRAIARRFATRYARTRTRARRGHLDLRHTMRRNVAYDGVPFRTAWKRRKIAKPRLVVLCDVSGSVSRVAHFFLLFVHGLSEALGDVRAYAFANRAVDVTDVLRGESFDDALLRVMRDLGFQSSDYGNAFAEFAAGGLDAVDRKTTVIVLGDGRTNYADPRVDVLHRVFERAKRVVWLNPEPRIAWGTDDSAMPSYLPYCHVARVCNRLRHLEEVATDVLGFT